MTKYNNGHLTVFWAFIKIFGGDGIQIEQAKESQYDELFKMMLKYSSHYLQTAASKLNLSMEQFKESFKTVGKVYVMYLQREIAGFFWIEKRHDVLHIHALIIKEQFQGRGLGKQILNLIQDEYSSGARTLELGVHFSNDKAIKLYESFGFAKVKQFDDMGFIVMQKYVKR